MDLLNLLKKQWDRTTAAILLIAGAAALISGWVGVSGTNLLSDQTPYIVSGGLGGIFLLGVGATLWMSADLRDEWRKLDRIERALHDGVLRWDDGEPTSPRDGRSVPEETAALNGAARHAVVADV